MAKIVCDLNGNWQFKEYPDSARRMRDLDEGNWYDTNIPSSIFTSLIEAGQIKPEELSANPEDFGWVSNKSWIFQKTFDIPQELLDCDRIELVFDGLDTVASIWVNDKLKAKTKNMFIPHRIDITDLVKQKNNRLLVKFEPAKTYAENLMARYGAFNAKDFRTPYRVYIRKAQYQFGWDFCPAMEGCGIFRPVYLEGTEKARIEDIHIRTIDCNQYYADVKISVKLDKTAKNPFDCSLAIGGGGITIEQTLRFEENDQLASALIRIDRPFMWWPKGYGIQYLYQLEAKLLAADVVIDKVNRKFGVRTVRLNRTKDHHGESFQFEINGQHIYAKGANWIRPSIFGGPVSETRYSQLLQAAVAANINMLRIGGCGCYEDAKFYELCDRLGLMVWQDFMFANGLYPDRQWFLDDVKNEAEAIIKQLRNYSSIVLWCGNSEVDLMFQSGFEGKKKKFYGKSIFHQILPDLLPELDPDREYIPTTPLGPKGKLNDTAHGSHHNHSVGSEYKPIRDYIASFPDIPRFVAKFGLASLPETETIKNFCPANSLKIGSYDLEKHNYQLDGNSRIYRYLGDIFGTAKNIEEFAYLTQITQARAAKSHVEYLRTNNTINSGVLLRQFNDCAPAISWSAIDYLNRPKAIYYYARRFFTPLMVNLVAEYLDKGYDYPPTPDSFFLVVINDTSKSVTATLSCSLINLKGEILDQSALPISVGPFATSTGRRLPRNFSDMLNNQQCMAAITLENNGDILTQNTFLFRPDKYINWPSAHIDTELSQKNESEWKLKLQSDAVAKDVYVTAPHTAKLSDNFFDLLPDRPYEITLCLPTAASEKPDFRIISVNSVFNT